METSQDAPRSRAQAAWGWVLARGVLAAVVAAVISLNTDHTQQFTATWFGMWAIATGFTIGWFALAGTHDTMDRFYGSSLAYLTAAAGGMAFGWSHFSDVPISVLIAIWALIAGVIELLSGLRLEAGSDTRSDQLISGALGVLFGIAQLGASDTTWSAGLLGLYTALLGVHLIIAAITLRSAHRAALRPAHDRQA